MRKCDYCQVAIKGDWTNCPLCQRPLMQIEKVVPSSYPDIPLQFNRQRIFKWLMWVSLGIVLVIFSLAYIWRGEIRLFEGSVLGVGTLWLIVLIILRKRQNLAKSIMYLLVSLSLISVYLDYLLGWAGWSLTYAIPIFCSASLLAMFISSWLVRMEAGDYILYFAAAGILGLVPVLFLMFDWVTVVMPAWISVILSVIMLLLIILFRWPEIRRELKKRTFI